MWVPQKPSHRAIPRSPYLTTCHPRSRLSCDWSDPVLWQGSMLRSRFDRRPSRASPVTTTNGIRGSQHFEGAPKEHGRGQARARYAEVRGLRSWRPRMGHAAPRRCMQQTVVDERTAAHVSPSNTRCFTRLPHSLTGETGTGIHRFRACTGSDPPKPSLARPMRHQTVCPLSCQPT